MFAGFSIKDAIGDSDSDDDTDLLQQRTKSKEENVKLYELSTVYLIFKIIYDFYA